ncbi:uncharacterized protein [Magallana gigas]|uniref:uncharacterized protein n=1 Tax=Magallana gigas TaxID=29159 RepID=UPI00333E41B9
MTQFRALNRKSEEVGMQHLWFFFCFLHLGYTTDLDKKCGEHSCCSGFYFDSSGDCVACLLGYYGVNCSFPCPNGYYGDRCRKICGCTQEMCNATFGCKRSFDVNYLDPVTLPTIIVTVLGLLVLFILFGTLIVLKMRQNTQLENSQVKLKTSDVTSPYENDLPVADLCGPVDFPPFQENKNVTDSQEKISMYDTCF